MPIRSGPLERIVRLRRGLARHAKAKHDPAHNRRRDCCNQVDSALLGRGGHRRANTCSDKPNKRAGELNIAEPTLMAGARTVEQGEKCGEYAATAREARQEVWPKRLVK